MSNILSSAANEIIYVLTAGTVLAAGLTAVAWLLIRLFRVRSSAYRHLVWLYCLIGIAVLPAVWCYGPKIKWPVLPPQVVSNQNSVQPVIKQASPQIAAAPVLSENHQAAPLAFPLQTVETSKITISMILAGIWLIGFGFSLFRLVVGWKKIRTVVRSAGPLPGLQHLADPNIRILVSRVIKGPVCLGILKPIILIPQDMMDGAGPKQLDMVINHELAHIRRRDPLVNLFQRLLEAVFFFHPCVWYAGRQLTQAREQICDNHVLARGTPAGDYVQLLARVAETHYHAQFQGAALFEGSLLQRIKSLLDTQGRRLTRISRRTIVVSALIVLIALILFGTLRLEAKAATQPNPAGMLTTTIKVVDETGKPVADAVIMPDGLRAKADLGGHYGWWSGTPKSYGPPISAKTNRTGVAKITYPKFISENLETGAISFSVKHPKFCPERPTNYSVTGSAEPVVLHKGATLIVSGYLEPNNDLPIPIHPIVSSKEMSIGQDAWSPTGNNTLATDQLPAGAHYLLLVAFDPQGLPQFSDFIFLEALKGNFFKYSLKIKPGTRLEGKLSPEAVRPIRNGRVVALVRPTGQKMDRDDHSPLGGVMMWQTWRNIKEDGTFLFESLPAGTVELIALCDGFISKDPSGRKGIRRPQSFILQGKSAQFTLKMEPTATARVKVIDERGNPIQGATVSFWPNADWYLVPSEGYGIFRQIFAEPIPRLEESLQENPETTLKKLIAQRQKPSNFQAKTDTQGIAVVVNLPGNRESFEVTHPNYRMPLRTTTLPFKILPRRDAVLDLAAGKTATIKVTLNKKNETPPNFSSQVTIPVTGRVVSQTDKKPIPHAVVRVAVPALDMRKIRGTTPPGLYETRTDMTGQFKIQVPVDSKTTGISLDVLAPGFRSAAGTYRSGGDFRLYNISVGRGENPNFTIELPPALYLTGTAVDEKGNPLSGVVIYGGFCDLKSCSTIGHTFTDRQGRFELFDFPTQKKPDEKPSLTFTSSTTVRKIIDNIYDLNKEQLANLRVVLSAGRTITGSLLNPAGKVVPHIMVEASGVSGRKAVVTDSAGRFRLAGLPEGKITLRVASLKLNQKIITDLVLQGRDREVTLRLHDLETGTPTKPITLLGMQVVDLTAELQKKYDLYHNAGVLILDPGSDYRRLGIDDLRAGYYFWEVGEKEIKNTREMVAELLRIQQIPAPTNGKMTHHQEGFHGLIRVVYAYRDLSGKGNNTQYLKLTDKDAEDLKKLAARLGMAKD
jgi:beta-lactamase regulating signal transducer with metallopeptidase domain